MSKFRMGLLAAAGLALIGQPAQANVETFIFYETSCTPSFFGTCFAQPSAPLPIATLEISHLSGTASWNGFPLTPPAVSDPLLLFDNYDHFGGVYIVGPLFMGATSYNISWTAQDDELLAISIESHGTNTITNLGLTGGLIGSDASLGTCRNGECTVTGFWRAVPEPSSMAILGAGLVGILAWQRRRRSAA